MARNIQKYTTWAYIALGGFVAGTCFGRTVFKKLCDFAHDSPETGKCSEDALPSRYRRKTSFKESDIMKFGYPSKDNIRVFSEFVLSYDKRNRVPNWVFELISAESLKPGKNVNREDSGFISDESFHEYFRAQNSDYNNSGYDRGHMVPAGNHKSNQKAMDETFYLSNTAPQVGIGFNRGFWKHLETYVRNLTDKYVKVYCCTGPLFLSHKERDGKKYVKYEVIGANEVAVPTHFFKVVLCETEKGEYEMEAFALPNEEIDSDKELYRYRVEPEIIEKAAGLLFYDKVPDKKLVKINGKEK